MASATPLLHRATPNDDATNGGRRISFNLQSRTIGYALAGTFRGQPTVANGVVYVSNNSRVEARSESDGSLQWVWIPPAGQPVAR